MNSKAVNLLSEYDMNVVQSWRGRGAILCDTDKGLFILKEYVGPPNKVPFLDKLLKQLRELGDVYIENIIKSKADEYLVYDRDKCAYMLKTYSSGHECDYQNMEECVAAVERLARLHKELEKIDMSVFGEEQDGENAFHLNEYFIMEEYEKHNRELKRVKQFLRKKSQKSNFELYLQDYYDLFFEQAVRITEELAYYEKLFANDKQKMICHGDFQYHNILFDREAIFLSNFEKCVVDYPIRDLYLFMRKLLEKNDWSTEIGHTLLEAYNRIHPINIGNQIELFYRFSYPEKFWKIVNYYNNSGKAFIPSKNMEKIDKLICQEENKRKFLEETLRF